MLGPSAGVSCDPAAFDLVGARWTMLGTARVSAADIAAARVALVGPGDGAAVGAGGDRPGAAGRPAGRLARDGADTRSVSRRDRRWPPGRAAAAWCERPPGASTPRAGEDAAAIGFLITALFAVALVWLAWTTTGALADRAPAPARRGSRIAVGLSSATPASAPLSARRRPLRRAGDASHAAAGVGGDPLRALAVDVGPPGAPRAGAVLLPRRGRRRGAGVVARGGPALPRPAAARAAASGACRAGRRRAPWASPCGIRRAGRCGRRVTALAVLLAMIASADWARGVLRRGTQPARLRGAAGGAAAAVAGALSGAVGRLPHAAAKRRSRANWRPDRAPAADLQLYLREALDQIDRLAGHVGPGGRVGAAGERPGGRRRGVSRVVADHLAARRLTSSVELYDPAGRIVNRFALNLPETAADQAWQESSCAWELFEEVSPFFAEERRLLHAGRGVCVDDGAGRASSARWSCTSCSTTATCRSWRRRTPTSGCCGPRPAAPEAGPRDDVAFAVYGWSRRPLFISGSDAWPLSDALFGRLAASRQPFWAVIEDRGVASDVYLLNDRGAIYAVGLSRAPRPSGIWRRWPSWSRWPASPSWRCSPASRGLAGWARARRCRAGRCCARSGPASTARCSSRSSPPWSCRSSRWRWSRAPTWRRRCCADIEREAARTALVGEPGRRGLRAHRVARRINLPALDDWLLVWLSRVIGEDINVFAGTGLLASSERNLFASGLLPTRTPGAVYRALALDGRPTFSPVSRVGTYEYLVGVGAGPRRRPAGDRQRAAHLAPTRDRARSSTSSIAACCWRRSPSSCSARRLATGRPSGSPTRSAASRAPRAGSPRRPRRARAGALGRRARPAGRGLQRHGRRPPAPARAARTHQPARGLGRDGAAGRPRHQEPADADPAQRRAPAPRPRRSRPAARPVSSTTASTTSCCRCGCCGSWRRSSPASPRRRRRGPSRRRWRRCSTSCCSLMCRRWPGASPSPSTCRRALPDAAGRPGAAGAGADQRRRERAARDAGHGTLTVTARPLPTGQVEIAVADTGVGMDAGGARPDLRAVLLDQGDRHRPRPDHRPAQRRAERRHHRRDQRAGPGHHRHAAAARGLNARARSRQAGARGSGRRLGRRLGQRRRCQGRRPPDPHYCPLDDRRHQVGVGHHHQHLLGVGGDQRHPGRHQHEHLDSCVAR